MDFDQILYSFLPFFLGVSKVNLLGAVEAARAGRQGPCPQRVILRLHRHAPRYEDLLLIGQRLRVERELIAAALQTTTHGRLRMVLSDR